MNSSNSLSVFYPRISLFSPVFCFFVVLSSRWRYFYFSLYLKFNHSIFYRYLFVLKGFFVFVFSSPVCLVSFLSFCFLLITFRMLAIFFIAFVFAGFFLFRGFFMSFGDFYDE